MAAEREPLYQAHASIEVQTSKTNPAIVVRQIMERLKGENHENA
jgi:shikimate kinase